jgi:DNA-binding NarL/FixJ family response regulator
MIHIVIVDNHRVLIDTLELVLYWEADFELIGAAPDLNSARQLIKTHPPDVLLLEVHLPDGDGLELIPYVQENSPKTKIIILTTSVDDILIMRAIDQNVHGILTKGCSLNELLSSIRAAANGDMAIASHLLIKVIKRQALSTKLARKNECVWEILTDREMDVLNCLALGKSGNMIAKELHIAPLTVRTHIRNLMSKLGVHTRLEAVSFALKQGIIEAPS